MTIDGAHHISTDLFGAERYIRNANKRTTERGTWLEHFAMKTGRDIKYIAFKLTGVPTADLAAFDKQCETYKGGYAKAFFGALKVRPTD